MRRSVVVLLLLAPPAAADPPIDAAFFEAKVRPILVAHCQGCHDAKKEKGGLRLTDRGSMMKGGDTGPAVVPGDAANSLLVQAVRYDGGLKMPPKGKLSADDIDVLAKWVAGSAPWPDVGAVVAVGPKGMDVKAVAAGHWAFRPIVRPAVPDGVNPVDHFVRAKLLAAGLTPAPPADPRTLVRRVFFDLIGLPPTPAEVEAFAADPSPAAYAKLIDSLLASPHYGERWGRHWLDLVRYAETHGHEFDFDIPNAWRYRDYVIRAFNADLPFDRFAAEHVAGDLLPPRVVGGVNEAVLGTGFWFLGEAKHSPVDVRQDQADRMDNMIDVFGKAFLGLTVSCARCHDHKFDPIPTRDYYALYGTLASSRYQQAFLDDAPAGEAAVPAPPPGDPAAWEAFADGWRGRWFPSGPAFRLGDGPPHSGREVAGFKGVLRSPTFTISSDVVAVRAAGRKARARLIVDNYQLIQDPIYGGLQKPIDHGEPLRWVSFDVTRWKGRAAYLELHDDGPGYVAATEVRFADRKPADAPGEVEPPPADAAKPPAPRQAPAMTDGNGFDERVFVRGNPKTPGEVVPRRFLELFAGPDAKSPATGSGRLELAKAVTDPANPLVARVFVNRVWQHHFGVGIVPTPDDFGRQGTPPTHPELLDWLASDFTASGWELKRLHRLMLLSDAYRQASRPHPDSAAKAATADPTNRLLHRANVRRLEAEAIRDAMLAASGRLDRTAGGPGVPPHLTEHMVGRGRPATSGPLDGDGRRSVYLQVRRNFPNPLFTAFDYPTPFTAIGRRGTSNVPAQSLVLLNNPFVLQQADRWGARAKAESGSDADKVRRMYLAAFARPPAADELSAALAFVADAGDWAGLAHALFNAKGFVFVE